MARVVRLADRWGAGTGAAVELGGVTVRYGGRVAMASVTLTVRPGQWLGLLGPNGAGKTTLLRAVAGLVRSEGDLRVGGRPLRSLGGRARARAVAYVPQAPILPPDMTVSDYVLLGRTPHIGYLRVETRADLEHTAGVIDRLDLGGLAGRHLGTLSGGERQRAVLARALAQEAPVLLLDEATSALDVAHRVEVLELVDDLRRHWGLTVVSALHDLTLAGQFCDRLLVLSHGEPAALGSPAEVFQEEVLGPVFGPLRIIRTDDGDLVIATRRTSAAPPGAERGRAATGGPATGGGRGSAATGEWGPAAAGGRGSAATGGQL